MCRQLIVVACAVLLYSNSTEALMGVGPLEGEKSTPILVLVATSSSVGIDLNEFIVVRTSGEQLHWSATSITNSGGSGYTKGPENDLVKLYESISSVHRVKPVIRETAPATRLFYSLILIDGESTRSLVSLDSRQIQGLRDSLAPIFSDIVKAHVYGKANPILGLLIPADSLRSTADVDAANKTRENVPKSVYPKTDR